MIPRRIENGREEYQGSDGQWYPVRVAGGDVRSDHSLSADQKRTIRRKQMLERGTHPCTKLPLLGEGDHHCRDCVHLRAHRGNRKTFYKCDVVGMTCGPATDTRLSWPACTSFEASGTQERAAR